MITIEELHRIAEKLAQQLCQEEVAPCTRKSSSGITCMQEARNRAGVIGFAHYDRHVFMCNGCMSYWLSLRLEATLKKLMG